MTLEGHEPIVVSEYDPEWPRFFEGLRDRAASTLGYLAVAIEHVGSTAVPGLPAKPIVDLDVVIRSEADLPEVIQRLATRGYRHEGEKGIADRDAFRWPIGERRHHLYVCPADSVELRRHLLFRDLLRRDPALAEAYGTLKRGLAARFQRARAAYNQAKSGFIEAALRLAARPGR